VERRGFTPGVIRALLERDILEKAFFGDEASVEALAEAVRANGRTVTTHRDEEHNRFQVQIEDRNGPHQRRMVVGAEFVSSSDYRTLHGTWRDVRDLRWPATVVALAQSAEDEAARAADDAAEVQALDAAEPSSPVARPAKGAPADVQIESLDELVEYFIAAGKKGVAINRYKGLGEMNPDQLWATTMDPEARTVLVVRAEDHTEADQMFTTLMGDQVEPRRKFIEDNALDVRNLDI
jgi:DNA gyrase subunit B